MGIPATSQNLNTKGKINLQKKLIESICEEIIDIEEFFGTSEFLLPMLNGGVRAAHLAYTEAHKKLLMLDNSSLKVNTCSFEFKLFGYGQT